jgi:hypothetical protein
MRATISFEIDVEHVEATMATLVSMEADTLRAVADMIDVQPGPRTMVLEEVTEALRLMQETTLQLQQYQQMLMSFEKAKFETILPQPVNSGSPAVPRSTPVENVNPFQEAIQSLSQFGDFVDRIPSEENPGEADDDTPKEG